MKTMVERGNIYDFVGGDEAFLALASALNDRCLADPVLNHPFSHPSHPQHLERLASYLAEVFGGPRGYSVLGGHSAMLSQHAGTGADEDYAVRFLACFDQAVQDAQFPDDPELRRALHDYIVWATSEVNEYSPVGVSAPEGLGMPRWSWEGPVWLPEVTSR
jgi:hemoglobin